MADLFFRQGIDSQYTGQSFTKVADNIVESGAAIGTIQNRDAVRIVYNDNFEKSIYGICTDPNTGQITFDDNVYPVDLTNITNSTVYKYNDPEVYSVESYRVGINVENGLYSKAFTQYSSEVYYTLITPSKKDSYFGLIDKLATSADIIFVDSCETKAYGVGMSEGFFDTLNNKFKTSLEFNIAKR